MILLFSDIIVFLSLTFQPYKNHQLGDIYLYNGLDSTHLGN